MRENGPAAERQGRGDDDKAGCLARLIRSGIAPPFHEQPVAGLAIHDTDGIALFDPTTNHQVFRRFEDIPPLLVQTLLFIENRSIGNGAGPRKNPAVDW